MNLGISFTNPWALLLWPPLVACFVWLSRRSLADLSPLRRRVATGVRIALTTLLVLALAGMQLVHFNRDLAVMFVVDYSDSVGPGAKEAAADYIDKAVKSRKPTDRWGVVVFGRDAYIDLAPGTAPTLDKIKTVVPTEFTDISAAIRLGMASLPDGMQKRLVILSDGNENLGDAVEESHVAANNDVGIDVVPLTSPQRHEVLLERLTLPSEAKIGEPLEIKVIGRATQDTKATIRLFRDGKYLGSRDVQMNRGKDVFVFPQTVTEAGPATFEAQVEAPKGMDSVAENNRTMGLVNVQGKPRVLLVSETPEDSQFLLQALGNEKLNVELRNSSGLPAQLREMQPYDAIILNNVPAWDLSSRQMLALQSYVRDLGCGLVMVGGQYSYGPGGYRSTPVEETLPVTMDIKNMQYIPGGAVAMIMHSLEFPDGNDWAKSICSQVIRQLGDNDYAGTCIFGMGPLWIDPSPGMLKVGPNRNLMLTDIRKIDPGDMLDFDSAMELCYSGLVNTKAYLKHLIILSDGDPSPPRPALVAKFNAARITVSTVVIQPHDQSGVQNMYVIAKEHGGRRYQVMNPKQLPNIFLKEAAKVSRSAIIEEPFVPRRGVESAIIKGISSMPPLKGYVATTAKNTSAQVLVTHQEDPLLATWQYGLGKAVAFTSDAKQQWAAHWVAWSGYSKFWAQAVRWSMRQSTASDLQTAVDIDKGVGKVTIEAVDEKGNFINFLNPKARLITPDLKGTDLSLDQTGPGRYEATFDARQLGTYLVNIRTERGGKTVSQITGGVLPYSPEYSAVGTDLALLSTIAEVGGSDKPLSLDRPEQVFARPRTPARLPQDVWLTLLIIATCLFPFDVAVRRLVWGEEEWQKARSRLRFKPTLPRRAPRAEAPRDEAMDRLLRTKQRAASGEAAPPAPAEPPPVVTWQAPASDASDQRSVTGAVPGSGGTVPPPSGSQPPPPTAPPPVATAPSAAEAPPAAAPPAPGEEELDPMERLRRAKRRARGEE